jgi:Uma2 family endonuclease
MSRANQPLYQGKKVTLTEYERLAPDGFQYEVIQGIMRMVPAPFYEHQNLIGELYWLLKNFLKNQPIGIVSIAPRDVKFAENLTYQPDILFISKERLAINKRQYVDGAPDFIVEVISKGTLLHDTREKYTVYEQYGVREYWILNPDNIEISEFFFLQAGQYKAIGLEDNIIKSQVITGFELSLNQLENI